MSKGGAGKVYFVLYLAVILELLIIFIERDEAEENLRKQQQQAIQIVQTILSQLQTGSGTTGITVNPKDNIVLDAEEPANNVRNYDVVVSVGDPKASVTHEGKTMKGDDVPKLNYTVSHIGNPDIPEEELGDDSTDITGGNKIFEAVLGTDVGSYTQPKQTYGGGIPADVTEAYFALNEEKTAKYLSQGMRVKVFSVNFKPNQGKGWYRLRFNSETNKILGISGELNPNDTVRIGNVKLTVKQLQQVQTALRKQRGQAEGELSQVERYIQTLLTPNAYRTLNENKGYQSFNVHVTEPPAVKPQDPVAEVIAPDTTYWFNIAPFSVQVKLGPKEGQKNVQGGARLTELDAARNLYVATYSDLKEGIQPLVATASNAGRTEQSAKTLVVEVPTLAVTPDRWKGLRATVSRKYNPSSEWRNPRIPASHYQTVVEINGSEVFSRAGVTFKDGDLPAELLITEGTKGVKTTVFWKPGGTADRTQWKALLSSDAATGAVIVPTKPIAISYPVPEHASGFEFEWVLSPKSMKKDLEGEIVVTQRIGENRTVGAQATLGACEECANNGVTIRLVPGSDEGRYTVRAEVTETAKLKPSISGKRFEIPLSIDGRGGASGGGTIWVTVKVAR